MRSRKDVDFSNRGRIDLSLSQISMIFRWSTSNRRRIDNRFLAGLIPDAKKSQITGLKKFQFKYSLNFSYIVPKIKSL